MTAITNTPTFKHYAYPSIEQFRQLVGEIRNKAQYVGRDIENKPIFDYNKPLPVVTADGTIKLHGTNASVVLDKEGNFYSQSRNNVLSLEFDNAGFNVFVMQNKDYFLSMLTQYMVDGVEAVVVYGEWCGANIQKGVGICELQKMFVVFDIRIVPCDVAGTRTWLSAFDIAKWNNQQIRVFNTQMFETYKIDLDVSDPARIQNQLIEFTNKVELCCPVAKYFGVDGVGEGIVWTVQYGDSRFSMKIVGQQHSKTKVKKLAAVDTEKLDSIDKFVEYAFTANRFEQGIQWMKENGHVIEMKNIPVFIKWVFGDIIKEESDALISNGLNTKDINAKGCYVIRQWYANQC